LYGSLDVYSKLTILDLKAAHEKYHPRERRIDGDDTERDGALQV